ncbi:unnamed protein product [Rodentolepis nana]|uniref:Conserved plasma membrane protein n=1 Tax=Rodentolepis nana TaxID=102285 RepID=A0A0R3TM73_RODNA|nr:unnamed protein product [Rodentolepis nana]
MDSVTADENTQNGPSSIRARRAKFTRPNSPSSIEMETHSDSDESDQYTSVYDSSDERESTKDVNNNMSADVCVGYLPAIILLCAVLSAVLCWCYYSSFSNSNANAPVYYQLTELEKSFPGQNPRLWAVLKSTIITRKRSSISNTDADTTDAPKVLLICPSSDPAKNGSYQLFLRRFENSLGNMKRHWKCAVIDPFKSLLNISPDQVKRNIHDEMEQAYRAGLKCLHVVGIDRLSGDSALALHGNTDPLNSPFRDAFLLFSIRQPPEVSSQTSQREMETVLRKYLRSLWERDLGRDAVYALINRLTGRIGIFEI